MFVIKQFWLSLTWHCKKH